MTVCATARAAVSSAAFVHPTAVLAEGVIIGPWVYIGEHVTVGEGTRIDPHAVILRHTRLGKNNHIHAHTAIGGDPQDLSYRNEEVWLEMGDDNIVREFVTISRGSTKSGITRIGNKNCFLNYSHVAHDARIGNEVLFINYASIGGHVTVEDFAIIGAYSTVHQFSRIGSYSFLAHAAQVTNDIPPYMLVKGAEGVPVTLNLVGLRRRGFSNEAISGLKKAFRLMYRQNLPLAELKVALAELKRVSSFLKLPKSVEEEAARIYRAAVQKGLVRGRSMESVVAGALYAACRRHEVPRTLDEMSEASGIEKKEIGRTYRFITRELEVTVKPSNPADYIPRFASALKLTAETQSKAVEILEMARDIELTSGRGPTGIAAAALYVASLVHGEKRTQREVADVAGVTEVTIRNRYKELIKRLKLTKQVEKSKKK